MGGSAPGGGQGYITDRITALDDRCSPEQLRALLIEARAVIIGRDRTIQEAAWQRAAHVVLEAIERHDEDAAREIMWRMLHPNA